MTNYQNPVVRGFNPDPSILCAEGAYYMVNSTFQYFPAVVIRRSTDLVNWTIVGHAITRPEWVALDGVPDSHGIWAPDISYSNGKYWIFAPLRLSGEGKRERVVLRRQLIMWADAPEGPYSKPVCIEVDDIDPSHFVDADGTHYLVTAPGVTLTRLSDDCTRAVGDTVTVWRGTGGRAPEGPHLFMKDGYYYAVLAEGGTGYGHSVTVARSKALRGEYSPCPRNPILTRRDDAARLQRCGHADFICLPDGRWFAAYLCARPLEGRLTTMGRETALQPVFWDEDGWPRMDAPLDSVPCPFDGCVQRDEPVFFDDFDAPRFSAQWQFVRLPSAEATLCERPGHYRIWTEDGDLNERRARNTLVRRETEPVYAACARVEFRPALDGEQAGLCCYYGTNAYIKCAVTREGVRLSYCAGEGETHVASLPVDTGGAVDVRVRVDGLRRAFDAREAGGAWRTVGELARCDFLCDESGLPGKHHTGTMVGLFANNGGCGSRIPADFDAFKYAPSAASVDF